MNDRRLYFLLPDVTHARSVVSDLVLAGKDRTEIHAMAKAGVDLENLPQATQRQRRDILHTLEDWFWKINLVVFFAALVALLWTLPEPSRLSIWMLLIMAVTFIGGYIWAQVPDTQIRQFRQELSHGEVLLMIDVPEQHLYNVEERVHRRHPEAIAGGATWMMDAFGL